MNEHVDAITSLEAALHRLRATWLTALDGTAFGPHADDDIAAMSDASLLAVNGALAALRRHADALHAHVAAAIATRSRPELGKDGLARKSGHRTPARLIAAATGGHAGDAHRLIHAGQAAAGRVMFSGERAPARHPHIGAALDRGILTVDAAALIASLLDRLALRVDRVRLAEAERSLVEQAATLSLSEMGVVVRRAEALLDPRGLEPKIDELRQERSLHIREEQSGMTSLVARLDPETAAPVKAAIDAIVGARLRACRGSASTGETDLTTDLLASGQGPRGEHGDSQVVAGRHSVADSQPTSATMTTSQMRADALADLCRHTLACEETALSSVNTTVIVRIPLEALVSGVGVATIDGMAQPIDAATARRMAGDAEIIPCVLGGESEVLDFGRARRLFTRAQKLALVERDGGCAFCGAPPQYAEGHHIRWWDAHYGSTDLNNLILL